MPRRVGTGHFVTHALVVIGVLALLATGPANAKKLRRAPRPNPAAAAPSRAEPAPGASSRDRSSPAAPGQTGPSRADSPATLEHTYIFWDLSPLGIDLETSALLGELLQAELKRFMGSHLLADRGIIDASVRHIVNGCTDRHQCITEAAAASGADRLIVGVASMLGDSYYLNLKLYDARTGESVSKAAASMSGDRSKMLQGIQDLVYELIDPSLLAGSLAVDVPMNGVAVLIDGKQVATTPLSGPIESLPVGKHALKLTGPFIKDYFSFFQIEHGKTTTLQVPLSSVEAVKAEIQASEEAVRVPIYKRWWFWAIAGGVAAAAGGAVIVASGGNDAQPTTLSTIDFR